MQENEHRSPEAFVREVLGNATDDLTGLYEVLWLANAWYPDWPVSARLQVAEQAVAELVSQGLVTLCRGEWEDAADHPVPSQETGAVLRDWTTWAIPEGPRVFIFATDAGIAKVMPQAGVPSEGSDPDPARSSG